MSSRKQLPISDGWRFRMVAANGDQTASANQEKLAEWSDVKSYPSVVQLELITSGIIPDPNIGENERLVQWVSKADWEYAVEFTSPPERSEHQDLVFEGLDTFATVRLNGVEILKSDNMFLPARVNVKNILHRDGTNNDLVILFESAEKVGAELEAQFGVLGPSIMRGTKRMHMRKPQSDWGWDWGPRLLTSGPYLPIYIENYSSRVDNIHVTTILNDTFDSAAITITASLGTVGASTSVDVTVSDQTGSSVFYKKTDLSGNQATFTTSLSKPDLWWPNGHGAQPIYRVQVRCLASDGSLLDVASTQFGIRKIELIQEPLDNAPGKTFMFRVNGHDIFAQGGNWIPADTILPRLTRQRYFDWIELAAYNNLNMIRVWGGGIYESEDFLDACDKYGLLVWHDFPFACGHFPVREDYLESVRQEAIMQTKRMRNRACLALLCGGNEDFVLQDWIKPGSYDIHDTKGPFLNTDFDWREIYLNVLPKVVEDIAPAVKYWPSSPWGGNSANDLTEGDVHQWDVWHLSQHPYQKYRDLSGRFVSEFGMHGFPSMRTVQTFLSSPADAHPQSKAIDCHNKGHGAHNRIARYLAENFRYSNELSDFVYCSQLMQSEAYGYALRDWKRKFGGKGKQLCSGAIIWQLNDIYPATSWAYIDYYLRPKPAFYTIRRAFAPISVGIERTPNTAWIDEDKPQLAAKYPTFAIYAHNTQQSQVSAILEIQIYDLTSAKYLDLPMDEKRKHVALAAGCNTELLELSPKGVPKGAQLVACAKLVSEDGRVLGRHVDWPEPYRYLTWPPNTKADFTVSSSSRVEWEKEVRIVANQPIKGFWLETRSTEGKDPLWEDNMLDLMPNQEIIVGVNGLSADLEARFLADWELIGSTTKSAKL